MGRLLPKPEPAPEWAIYNAAEWWVVLHKGCRVIDFDGEPITERPFAAPSDLRLALENPNVARAITSDQGAVLLMMAHHTWQPHGSGPPPAHSGGNIGLVTRAWQARLCKFLGVEMPGDRT